MTVRDLNDIESQSWLREISVAVLTEGFNPHALLCPHARGGPIGQCSCLSSTINNRLKTTEEELMCTKRCMISDTWA